jgi:hypothetical protein
MLDKSKINTVYLERGDEPEAIPIELAQFSRYTDEHGEWLLLLIRCPDYRHVELGLPLPDGFELQAGSVLKGGAYDDSLGGWLTNMYYYTHFGVESVVLAIESFDESEATITCTGDISDGGLDHDTICFTARATLNSELRKSFA